MNEIEIIDKSDQPTRTGRPRKYPREIDALRTMPDDKVLKLPRLTGKDLVNFRWTCRYHGLLVSIRNNAENSFVAVRERLATGNGH